MAESIAQLDPDDASRIRRLLLSAKWVFAVTMAERNPHHYTLRKTWSDADFDWAVETIRRYGYKERFGSRDYTMFSADGFKYWTMGAPVKETILINRKPLTQP